MLIPGGSVWARYWVCLISSAKFQWVLHRPKLITLPLTLLLSRGEHFSTRHLTRVIILIGIILKYNAPKDRVENMYF